MRGWWITASVVAVMGVGSMVGAQVTRVATFENFVEGQSFQSFTDPLSGINFRDSTNPFGGGFVIDYSSAYFGGSKYLTAGGWERGNAGGLGGSFGFTADLPEAANRVSLASEWSGPLVTMRLMAFNGLGELVGEHIGSGGLAPFTFEVRSAHYDISTIVMAVGLNSVSYDNISFTVLPEPAGSVGGVGVVMVGMVGRRRVR